MHAVKLRLLDHYPHQADARRYRVTPFKLTGLYPRGSFGTASACFFADDELVFAVTPDIRWSRTEKLPYSEVDWMQPELVRLLGALMFCERFTDRRCMFYPVAHGDVFITGAALDLQSAGSIASVRRLIEGLPAFRTPRRPEDLARFWGPSDPSEINIRWMQRYWHSISSDNLVAIRAIQALVKCDMLTVYPEFEEEAGIATFIAMDAVFELVQRHLKSQGLKTPTAKDVKRPGF